MGSRKPLLIAAAAAAAAALLGGGGWALRRAGAARRRRRGPAAEVVSGPAATLSTAGLGPDAISVVSWNILVRGGGGGVRPVAVAAWGRAQWRRACCGPQRAVRPPAAAPLPILNASSLPPTPQADRFAWGLTYCPPEFLEWGHRWRLVTGTLAALDADVVCLQEVDSAK
jgi:hypothetical protein